jgi:acylphosphatase
MQHGDSANEEAWLLRVHGRVQGVGFRDGCVDAAQAAGLRGWVRNRRDGTVEMLVQGPPAQLGRWRSGLRQLVPHARVDAIEDTPCAPDPALRGFERRPTE